MHYNGLSSYLFVNGTEIIKSKAKDSEIVATPSWLGNFSKDFSVDNTRKTGLNGYAYDLLTKEYVIKDLFEILAIVNVINYVMLENI